ncbi:MAG: sensor histidine kinase [Planctomycetota bacterium]
MYNLLRDEPERAEELARRIAAQGADLDRAERAPPILAIGWCRLRLGAPEDAIVLADEALVLLDGTSWRRVRARAYQLLAGAHHALGEHDAGIRAARRATELLDAPPPDTEGHEQSIRRVAQIGGGIAHDMKNMLTAILGYAERAGTQVEPDSRAARSLGRIRKAANHAHKLIRDVLLLSRRTERSRQPLRLQTIVREAAELVRGDPAIHVRDEIDPATGPVFADATQVQRIAANLLENACAAMAPAGGVLTVALHETDVGADQALATPGLEAGRHVVLRITDTGHGMDEATRNRIFEPYFTTRPDPQGHGLGLSVVQSIVTGHGGALTVESELGVGTTFCVYLRRASA